MSAFKQLREIAGQSGLNHRIPAEIGFDWDAAFQLVDDECELKRDRVLGPQAAVVIEDGDPFGDRYEISAAVRPAARVDAAASRVNPT